MLKSDRNRQVLTLILIVAALIRIPVAAYMGDQVTELPGIQDQISYDALARSLLDGRGYSFREAWYPFTPANTPTSHWSFIYPVYLAGIYAISGYHPLIARILQTVVGSVLTCFLIYKIGRRVVNEATGLAAAALAAVYGYFIYYNAALMTETFFMVLVLLTLYLSIEIKENPTLIRWVGLGCSLGVAVLLRQTVLIFAPILLLWLFAELKDKSSRWWHFSIPIIIIILFVMPWTIRNYRVYDQFLLLNSNAGYALFASNNPGLGTNWDNELVVVPVPQELKGQNEAQLDRALTRKGIEYIISDPERYVFLTLNKTLEYFWFWPSATSSRISNINRVLSFGLYLPFMLVGLYLSFSRWRRFVVLYLFILVHTTIHLLSWPAPRYRLTVDAVAMVFAAQAVLELVKWAKNWRHRNLISDEARA
ncbi:MAG TPA: glycosyltransferase family 39 protein [Anaerolineales bacterium]|nr:glycosyltransferase family 39 protein [Anaerolineales bacterium]